MIEQVTKMYETITMPSETEQKILWAMAQSQPRREVLRRLASGMAAFAAVLLLTFAVSPKVRAAVEEWTRKYVFPEVGMTIYEREDGNGIYAETWYDTEAPAFAEVREGRLYFTGNGENLDITDQIGQETPFFYTYENEDGHLVHMAVGMEGEIENFGIYAFIREQGEGLKPWEGWITGAGRNFLNPETEMRYPWVDIVWEKLNIPWPMPGEEDPSYEVTAKENPQGEVEAFEIKKNLTEEKYRGGHCGRPYSCYFISSISFAIRQPAWWTQFP